MLTLKTQPREANLSKGELNKLRKDGKVPACLYGAGLKNENFFIDKIDFEKIFAEEGKIFETEVGGKKHLTNAKEIQLSSVAHDLVHVSFVKLRKGETTTVLIPVQLVGDAPGEKDGGNVVVTHEHIKVDGIPSKIPSHLEVDISALNMEETIHINEIKLPEGIVIHESEDPERGVVICHRPSQSESDEEETEPELIGEETEAKAEGDEGE